MPLPPSATQRKHIHTRRIVCEAYEREDGLWDVEANMTDVKTYDTERGKAGQPLHDMWVRLTLDTQFVIRGIESAMDAYPQDACPYAVNPVWPFEGRRRFARLLQELVGVKIGAGWQGERQRIGGALGCTHLRELLAPIRERSDAVLRTAVGDHGDVGDGRCAAPVGRGSRVRARGPATPNPMRPIACGIGRRFSRASDSAPLRSPAHSHGFSECCH